MAFKHIHLLTVVLSILGFAARGLGVMFDASWMKARWVKIVPHVNDTLLLISALILMVITNQYPFEQSWLTAKLFALVVYIGLGVVAFRLGKDKKQKLTAWALGMGVVFYIAVTAVSRNPWWIF
jgi:uncharacterized membrane protein SirB2